MASILEKDETILEVINKLFDKFGESNFQLTNYWDSDLCAIGIKNSKDSNNLIYISTYKIKKKHYFVEVEDSNQKVVLSGYKSGEFWERSFDELSEIIKEYLCLKPL